MTSLTLEEFSLFSESSQISLLKKDGKLIKQRYLNDYTLISLYSIYGFKIETTLDVSNMKTTSVKPVFNKEVLMLYPA